MLILFNPFTTPLPLIHFLFTVQFIWYCQISQGQNSKTNPNFPKHLQSAVLQSASKCLQANCQMAFCNSCCAHMALFLFFTTKFCGFDSHPKLGRIYNFVMKSIRTVDWKSAPHFLQIIRQKFQKRKSTGFFPVKFHPTCGNLIQPDPEACPERVLEIM